MYNDITPYYYGLFKEQVLNGMIPISKEIELEMNRIDQLIENPEYYYDPNKVEGYIKFCETELCLVDGSPLILLDSFKIWAEELYGWYHYVEKTIITDEDGYKTTKKILVLQRLIKKQYIITARGSAKTLYATTIQAYELCTSTETTSQIATAPTVRQGMEVLIPLKTALTQAHGPLLRMYTDGNIRSTSGYSADRVKMASTKKGIENFITGSLLEVRPMTIEKMQSLRCKVATIDEWLSCNIREDVIGAIEQGSSKVKNYIILAISSEGTIRNSSGDTIKLELHSILKGEYNAPHISIWHYKLDSIDEVNDPNTWIKANPNLGITVPYESYILDVERAEKNPSARNDILAKRFGIPSEGYTYFFTYEETLPSKKFLDFSGMACSLGIDLSLGDDFCSFSFLFPLNNGGFGIDTKNYITIKAMTRLSLAMYIKYQEFIKEGSLIVMETSVLDMIDIYDDLQNYIDDKKYDVRCVGYDPYNAREFIERWKQENSAYGIETVPQGAKTESVPLGELKSISEDGGLLFNQEIFSFAMGNCIVLEDTNGNRKLYKKRNRDKIDSVAATMDAYISYKINREEF